MCIHLLWSIGPVPPQLNFLQLLSKEVLSQLQRGEPRQVPSVAWPYWATTGRRSKPHSQRPHYQIHVWWQWWAILWKALIQFLAASQSSSVACSWLPQWQKWGASNWVTQLRRNRAVVESSASFQNTHWLRWTLTAAHGYTPGNRVQ